MARLQTTSVTGSLLVSTFISASASISGSGFYSHADSRFNGSILVKDNISSSAGIYYGNGSGLTNVVAASAGSVTNALTAGSGISMSGGTTFNGSAARTISIASPIAITSGGLGFAMTPGTPGGYIVKDNNAGTTKLLSGTGIPGQDVNGNIVLFSTADTIPRVSDAGYVAASIIQDDGTNAAAGGVVDAAYKFKVHGHLGVTGTVYETSTIKVKTNIETLTDEISKLLQVRPVEFDYIENGEHSYGLIAEELNETYPDAVIKDDQGETIGVAYADLTSPIIRGIQQLYEKISQLEERIKTLEGN